MKTLARVLWAWWTCYTAMTTARACEYSKFSPSHTMCLFKSPGCPLMKKGVSSSEVSLIVDVHNKLRQKVANGQEAEGGGQPPAANMRHMEWDEELASAAQKWAEQCKTQHDCADCRRVPRFRVGQNVYMFASSEDNSSSDWPATLGEWYNEVSIFKTSQISPFKHTMATGHYSQFVWAETYKIGCGWAYYKKGIWFTKLYVCDYGPGQVELNSMYSAHMVWVDDLIQTVIQMTAVSDGNILSTEMYAKGKSCASCPEQTTCSQKYPGLCASSQSAPQRWPERTIAASSTAKPSTAPPRSPWSGWWPRTTTPGGWSQGANKVLFACDFDSEACKVDTAGTGRWSVQRSGQRGTNNYYEVKVRPGEDAHLYLYMANGGVIGTTSSRQACLGFRYRKYPQSSRTAMADTAQLEAVIWKRGQQEPFAEHNFSNSARTWSFHQITVAVHPQIYSVSFHLNADSFLGSAQYVSLDDVRLQNGPCT